MSLISGGACTAAWTSRYRSREKCKKREIFASVSSFVAASLQAANIFNHVSLFNHVDGASILDVVSFYLDALPVMFFGLCFLFAVLVART